MQILLIFTLPMVLSPFLVALNLVEGVPWWEGFLTAAGCCLLSGIGFVGRFFLRKWIRRKPLQMRIVFSILLLLLCVGGTIFYPYPFVFFRFLVGLCFSASFFAGVKLMDTTKSQMFHSFVLCGIYVWILFWGILSGFSGTVSTIPMAILLLYYTVLFALGANDITTENIMLYNERDTDTISAQVHTRGRRATLIFSGIAILIFLVYRPLTKGIVFILKTIVKYIIRGILWILSIGASDGVEEDVEEETQTAVTQAVQQGNPWVRYLIWGIGCALLLGVLFYFRKAILEGIQNAFYRLLESVSLLFRKFLPQEETEQTFYRDSTNSLWEEDAKQENKKEKNILQSRRKALRKYKRMQDSPQRFCLGYRIAIMDLPLECQEETLSVQERLEKLPETASREQWRTISEGYELAAYGEILPNKMYFQVLQTVLFK